MFHANNPTKKLEDIISNIRIGEVGGVVNVNIETVDKYVMISANGSLSTPDYKGNTITIKPYISTPESHDLYESDHEVYYDHPDYYRIQLCVEMDYAYTSVIIPLKYEYFVSFVPDDLCMNYGCLNKADVTVWEN